MYVAIYSARLSCAPLDMQLLYRSALCNDAPIKTYNTFPPNSLYTLQPLRSALIARSGHPFKVDPIA